MTRPSPGFDRLAAIMDRTPEPRTITPPRAVPPVRRDMAAIRRRALVLRALARATRRETT